MPVARNSIGNAKLLEKNSRCDLIAAFGQGPRFANKSLVFDRQRRFVALLDGQEFRLLGHHSHCVIQSLFPSSSGLGADAVTQLFIHGCQEQSSRFLIQKET